MSDAFSRRLPLIYGFYTGSFILFIIALYIGELMGLSGTTINWTFLTVTIGLYALVGILSRTASIPEYYVAGRRVPAIFNGMAVGADWMSAASFIGLAGSLYLLGFDGMAYILGWTGGYVLVGLLLAPYLRKFGQFTIPDFLGARYGGRLARIFGLLAAILVSFTYLVAQVTGAGIITSRILEVSFETGVFFGLSGILVCSLLGGMRAVTWTQVAQYIILIIAYLLPIIWLSQKFTGIPIPQLTYGIALEQIAALEVELGVEQPHSQPFTHLDPLNFFALAFCLMIGTASLPHILMRYYTTPTVRAARASVAWSLFFIGLLYLSAPAYAAFAKLEIYQNVVGSTIDSLPSWVESWAQVGLITIADGNGDGILQLGELRISTDAIVLATPEIAGLPLVIAGLIAAGGLAAALSTADGLLLTISNALSHDLYYKIINPSASTRRRLLLARLLLLAVAVCAAALAASQLAGILDIVAWAFSLAAATFFPALVLGIFWKRANRVGAVVGMATGFSVTLFYLVAVQFMGMAPWWGVKAIAAGLFGLPLGTLAMVIATLLSPPPTQAEAELVQEIRYPNLDAYEAP